MRKFIALTSLALTILALAACESAPAPRSAAAPGGTPLGDTGIHVAGTVQTGGPASLR